MRFHSSSSLLLLLLHGVCTLLENHSVSASYPFQPLDINDIGQTNYPNKCENVTRSIRIHGTKITPAAVAAAVAK